MPERGKKDPSLMPVGVDTLTIPAGYVSKPPMPFVPSAPVPAEVSQRKSVPPPPPPPPAPATRESTLAGEKKGNQIGAWGAGSKDTKESGGTPGTSGTALAFSNAAAGVKVDEKNLAAQQGVNAGAGGSVKGEWVELIGLDAETVPRMRKHGAWKKLLADVYGKVKAKEEDEGGERAKEAKDARDAVLILRRGEVISGDKVMEQMWEAMEGVGHLPPLVLLSGDLEMGFDEMEVLKALLVAVAPFIPGDKKLKDTVDVVREVMGTAGIERARGMLERLSGRIREAFGQGGRGVPAGYLEGQVEGMLLEGRCYQRRRVMGGVWLRGNYWYMGESGEERRIPVYVGESMGEGLPLFRRFGVRMVCEARVRVEQGEACEVALRVAAMGRRVGR